MHSIAKVRTPNLTSAHSRGLNNLVAHDSLTADTGEVPDNLPTSTVLPESSIWPWPLMDTGFFGFEQMNEFNAGDDAAHLRTPL